MKKNERQNTWNPNWPTRITARLEALGFTSIMDYVRAFPGEGVLALADRLGADVAATQLIRMVAEEGRRRGRLRDAVRELLARRVPDHLPGGWGTGADCEFNTAGVYSSWAATLVVDGGCEHLKPEMKAVWNALKALAPPTGWKPATGDDPLIVAAFEKGWSEAKEA